MIDAIRLGSISKGYDPGDFVLVAFGGAGAAFVAEIARDLGIPKSVVPPHPGVGAAAGLLSTDIRYEYMASHWADLQGADLSAVAAKYRTMAAEAGRELARDGFADADVSVVFEADCRYKGTRLRTPRRSANGLRRWLEDRCRRRVPPGARAPLSPPFCRHSGPVRQYSRRRRRPGAFRRSTRPALRWRKGRVGYRPGRGANRRPKPHCRLPCRRGLDPQRRHRLSARRAPARYGSRGTGHRSSRKTPRPSFRRISAQRRTGVAT